MAKLTFTGRSGDGKRLLLVDESGQEHSLAIDARLRRALSGTPESTGPDRFGQLEIPMESTLRPRDIQTRIRAGESPESVAHAAGTSVEKIMPFAAPVMAERAHVAERAQLASVRRRSSESGARTLGEAVDAHLRAHNVDPGQRRVGRLPPRGRSLDPDRALRRRRPHRCRDLLPRPARQLRHRRRRGRPLARRRRHPGGPRASRAADDLALARQRRLSAIGDDVPLGEDAIEMVGGEPPRRPPHPTRPPWRSAAPRWAPSSRWRPTSTGTDTTAATAADRDDEGRPRTSRSRPRRPPPSRSPSPPRSAAARRCRAGTRSCSAAARTTDAGAPAPPQRPPAQVRGHPSGRRGDVLPRGLVDDRSWMVVDRDLPPRLGARGAGAVHGGGRHPRHRPDGRRRHCDCARPAHPDLHLDEPHGDAA